MNEDEIRQDERARLATVLLEVGCRGFPSCGCCQRALAIITAPSNRNADRNTTSEGSAK
jgi:hypothetical protein